MKRAFPIGNKGQTIMLTVDKDGRPKRSGNTWKTMLANAAAKQPADRSPAERAALTNEMPRALSDQERLESAHALGMRAAAAGITDNPFTTEQFRLMWEAGRKAGLA